MSCLIPSSMKSKGYSQLLQHPTIEQTICPSYMGQRFLWLVALAPKFDFRDFIIAGITRKVAVDGAWTKMKTWDKYGLLLYGKEQPK